MLPPTILSLLLVTPFNPSLFSEDPSNCLTQNYHGSYNGQSIFMTDFPCIESYIPQLASATIIHISPGVQKLVWIEQKAVEDTLKLQAASTADFDEFLQRLGSRDVLDESHPDREQQVLSSQGEVKRSFELLWRTESSALLSVNHETALTIDTILPRFWKSTVIPTEPVSYLPVPRAAVERIKDLLASLKFDPVVASIVNNISIAQMKNDIRFLTGEDGQSDIVSRHSFAEGSRTAAKWLKARFEDTGASCELKTFLSGFAPNVVCRYTGTVDTNATVLISAHYDSRGSFGSTRAPGGNDDGSGIIALLGIARTIARKRLTFRSNVELVGFAGEEQGLYGSRAYSRELRAADANITLMIQADMIGYHASGEPAQLGLPARIGTPEVTNLVAKAASIYSSELNVGFTPACCSDHQSFHEQGFPATQVFERAGPIADPMYHNSGDLSEREGYDFDQIKSIARVQFATLLHAAGFDRSA